MPPKEFSSLPHSACLLLAFARAGKSMVGVGWWIKCGLGKKGFYQMELVAPSD
jgi:hypothetical protein